MNTPHLTPRALDRIWAGRYPADVPADIDPDIYASLSDLLDKIRNSE